MNFKLKLVVIILCLNLYNYDNAIANEIQTDQILTKLDDLHNTKENMTDVLFKIKKNHADIGRILIQCGIPDDTNNLLKIQNIEFNLNKLSYIISNIKCEYNEIFSIKNDILKSIDYLNNNGISKEICNNMRNFLNKL